MKKRRFIQVMAMLLSAMLLLSACQGNESSGDEKESESNTYETPIVMAEKLLNAASGEKLVNGIPTLLNGFGETEAKKVIEILKKSDQYEDAMEALDDGYAELVENMKDEYGSNYKIKIKVDEKEKLEKEDLKEFREQLREIGEIGEQIDEMTADDYEDMAYSIGITEAQAKDIAKNVKSLTDKCNSAEVEDGYELNLVISITGSELDEPEENDVTVRVFKVDGRWIPDVFALIQNIGMGSFGNLVGGMY